MRAGAAGPRRERDAQRHASEGSCRAVGRVPRGTSGRRPVVPRAGRVRGRSADAAAASAASAVVTRRAETPAAAAGAAGGRE